jgi:hypothetical protein
MFFDTWLPIILIFGSFGWFAGAVSAATAGGRRVLAVLCVVIGVACLVGGYYILFLNPVKAPPDQQNCPVGDPTDPGC